MLKEKLKNLKVEIKTWNKEIFGDVIVKIKEVIKGIYGIYLLDENGEAGVVKFGKRKELVGDFWRQSNLNESIL